MKFTSILMQAYPLCESKGRNWRVIISISLFVAIFMLVFQPFGLASLPDNFKVPVLGGYGLVSLLILILNLIVIESLFNEERWKVYKELIWTMWIILSIGLANYLYTISIFDVSIPPLRFLLQLELSTFAIGIFPVSILVILRYQRLNKTNTQSAAMLEEAISGRQDNYPPYPESDFVLKSENKKEQLNINPDSLNYIESKGNYVYIVYNEGGEIKRQMQRNTLNNVLNQLSAYKFIVKCHRSFIVNKNIICMVSGNAQGLKLELTNLDIIIPVSRSYIDAFR